LIVFALSLEGSLISWFRIRILPAESASCRRFPSLYDSG